jgi:mannose-6-phosphate isomerase
VELTAADRPGDPGVLLTLLLNYTRLAPGEALFLPAGNVHAYLRGSGVEVMSSSDNVLRCGLTTKHVDVDELLRITDFRPADLRQPGVAVPDGVCFRPPVAEFSLARLSVGPGSTRLAGGPAIVLCTSGSASLDRTVLRSGSAAFVRADAGTPVLDGSATLFVARPGEAPGET